MPRSDGSASTDSGTIATSLNLGSITVNTAIVGVVCELHAPLASHAMSTVPQSSCTASQLIHLACHGCCTRRPGEITRGSGGIGVRWVRFVNEGFVGIRDISLVNCISHFGFKYIRFACCRPRLDGIGAAV